MKTPIDEYNNRLKSLLEKGTGAKISVTTDDKSNSFRYSNIKLKVTDDYILTFIPIRNANLLRLTAVNFKLQEVHFICFEDDLHTIIKANES